MPNWKHVAVTALISVLAVALFNKFAPASVKAFLA